ncbi:MAG: response regulator transcription factor [Chloroflexota bacterium]
MVDGTSINDGEEMIRILIADDQEFAVRGLNDLFEDVEDMIVVALCRTANEVEREVQQLAPDIVLLDLSWYRIDEIGFYLVEAIRKLSPTTKIIPISNYPELLEKVGKMGTDPLDKGFTIQQLFDHIRKVHTADGYANESVIMDDLTERETEILQLISQGDGDKEIAQKLNISVSTVKKHVRNILSKTKARTRAEAAVKAKTAGLI